MIGIVLGGGGQVCIRVQGMWQTRGILGYAPPGNFDFGPFIGCNLVDLGQFSHKHTNISYHLLCH